MPTRKSSMAKVSLYEAASQINLAYPLYYISHGSENIPVEKSSAPRFETWNGSRDPSETNLAWVDLGRLNMGHFCAIDHALF